MRFAGDNPRLFVAARVTSEFPVALRPDAVCFEQAICTRGPAGLCRLSALSGCTGLLTCPASLQAGLFLCPKPCPLPFPIGALANPYTPQSPMRRSPNRRAAVRGLVSRATRWTTSGLPFSIHALVWKYSQSGRYGAWSIFPSLRDRHVVPTKRAFHGSAGNVSAALFRRVKRSIGGLDQIPRMSSAFPSKQAADP